MFRIIKAGIMLTVMCIFLMLIGACNCTCQQEKTGKKAPTATTQTNTGQLSSEVERMFIPSQTDPKSVVIRKISQGLGKAFTAKRSPNLIIVNNRQNATCLFKIGLKSAKFSDTGWVKAPTAGKPTGTGPDKLNWQEYKRTSHYKVAISYTVQGLKPGATEVKGNAGAEASQDLTFRQQTAEKNATVKPKFPKVSPQTERQKKLALKCSQEIIKEITNKLIAYYDKKN